jgi:hypothetical protein
MIWGPDLASQASVTSYEAQALVFPLGLKEDPDRYKVFEMGKQKHARYCGRGAEPSMLACCSAL